MPKFVTDFVPTAKHTPTLKVPQARVLAVLCPDEGDDPPLGTVGRNTLLSAAGFLPTSGMVNRVLGGIGKGSSSGTPHPGLLALGLVEQVTLDLDGRTLLSYRITRAGIVAIRNWLTTNKLPPKRDEKACTNQRYVNDSAN